MTLTRLQLNKTIGGFTMRTIKNYKFIKPKDFVKCFNRINFVWREPWVGKTPGTITYVGEERNLVVVKWDDKTTTKTSIQWVKDHCERL